MSKNMAKQEKKAGTTTQHSTAKQKPTSAAAKTSAIRPLLLLALLFVVAGAWHLYERQKQGQNQYQQQLASTLQANKNLRHDLNTQNAQIKQLQQDVRTIKQTSLTRAALTQTRSELDTLQEAFLALKKTTRHNDDNPWMAAEALYLVNIAHYRLQFERDSNSALIALKRADQRLRAAADKRHIETRRLLAAKIAQLTALKPTDISTTLEDLQRLEDSIDHLSLKQLTQGTQDHSADENPATANITQENAVVDKVLNALKKLVIIKHQQDATLPLRFDQVYALRANLKLYLSSARLALLAADHPSFQHALANAKKWIIKYGDHKSPLTNTMLDDISRISATTLSPQELPDLDDIITMMQNNN